MPDLNEVFVIGAQLQNQNYAVLIGRDILKDMILIYDVPALELPLPIESFCEIKLLKQKLAWEPVPYHRTQADLARGLPGSNGPTGSP